MEYTPCEQLFPGWNNSRYILNEFVGKIDGFKVCFSNFSNTSVSIGFNVPVIKKKDEEIPMFNTFPEKYKEDVFSALFDVIYKRIEEMDIAKKYITKAINNTTLKMIEQDMYDYDDYKVASGGKSVKEELAIRLGIFSDYYKIKWDLR